MGFGSPRQSAIAIAAPTISQKKRTDHLNNTALGELPAAMSCGERRLHQGGSDMVIPVGTPGAASGAARLFEPRLRRRIPLGTLLRAPNIPRPLPLVAAPLSAPPA